MFLMEGGRRKTEVTSRSRFKKGTLKGDDGVAGSGL